MAQSNIISTKKQRLERQKNRLNQQEALIKQLERKERTRKLIALGGLIVKAKLDDIDTNTLLGGLLTLAEQKIADPAITETWSQKGKATFDQENQDKVAVIVTFEEKPSAELRAQIRELGLKWNQFRKEWQGHVVLEELNQVLDGTKYTSIRVGIDVTEQPIIHN
ncbi:MAG: conjugal transfer protein TraD [Pseudomonadota bacterium]